MAFHTPSLKGRALRLLSGREYSRAELMQKLQRFEEEPGSLALALDELQTKGFINEQRVIESVLYRRAAKLGLVRIKQELQAKGLAPEAVSAALGDLRASEHERAQALWQKKFGVVAAEPQAAAKQMRFLMARGFGAEVVRRVVDGRAVK